jgi:hypothetical protein
MALATREELLSKLGRAKRRYREIHLPVSDLTVRIRSLTEGELSSYQRKLFAKGGRGLDPTALRTANRRLFALCLVDEQGNRLFSDSDVDTMVEMDSMDSGKLYEACSEHCGIDRTDMGDLSELEKNSGTTRDDCSPSD